MLILKQSTASQEVAFGPFVDDTDGKTAETGLTIANTDIKIHKAGATTLANKNSGGATHISNGVYYAVFDDTDTNTVGSGQISIHVSGALPVRRDFCVLPSAIYDWLTAGAAPLSPTVAGRTLDVSAGGEAGLDWANIGSPTTTQNLSATNIDVDQVVASVSGAVGSVTGAVGSVTGDVGGNVTGTIGGLTAAALKDFFDTDSTTTYASAVAGSVVKEIADNAGGSSLTAADIADAVWDEAATGHTDAGKAGAQLWTSIDAILDDTDEIGTAGAGLTDIPWNADWDAEVESEVNDGLVAYDAATGADISGLNDLSAAQVNAEVDAALADYDGPTYTEMTSAFSALNDVSTADVNAEVVDALATDTYAEPGTGAPAATTTIAQKINYLYKWTRNKKDNDGATTQFYADDASTVHHSQTTSESGGTVTKGEIGGP